MEYSSTQLKILEVGKKEFLKHGFKDASLRGIVKEAGFTQGAFYGYYKDKASLFDAIVSSVYKELITQFTQAQEEHFALIPKEETKATMDLSVNYLKYFVNYMYDNYDAFKLIICCSEGTRYETFTHDLVEMDAKRGYEYLTILKEAGKLEGVLSYELYHMITSAYFTAIFEMVVHDMPREKSMDYVEGIEKFFTSGWNGVLTYL